MIVPTKSIGCCARESSNVMSRGEQKKKKMRTKSLRYTKLYNIKSRAARYSKINLDIVLSCLKVQDNNRHNISI